jgi:hypothetical protein
VHKVLDKASWKMIRSLYAHVGIRDVLYYLYKSIRRVGDVLDYVDKLNGDLVSGFEN